MTWLQERRCQKDAAIACAANIHPEDGHAFRVMEAPGPEEVLSLMVQTAVLRQRSCWTLFIIACVGAKQAYICKLGVGTCGVWMWDVRQAVLAMSC